MRDDLDALDAAFDSLAQTEREAYEKGLGEGILGAIGSVEERRAAENRALLEALHPATEPEDDNQ
jgi:hypothetical protein